jgi:hypothetical protein
MAGDDESEKKIAIIASVEVTDNKYGICPSCNKAMEKWLTVGRREED